ncbi:MAG TPA: dihydroorotate dehydrogenase [Chloroflexota bacterium]
MDLTLVPRSNLHLKSPVIAASGTFGYGTEFASHADVNGLGAIICKGTTRLPRTGNEPLRLVNTPAGMLNAIGLQNIGVDAVADEKAPQWARMDVPVLVNVSGVSVEDYCEIARRLDGVAGIAGIELNISCPNIREGGVMFGTDARMAAEVTAAVRAMTELPLLVKLSPNVTDIVPIACAVEQAGADVISLINTVYAMSIDRRHREPAFANVTGGLSGPAVKPLALYLVYAVAAAVQVPVVGIGGIMSADDALEFMMAGASAVQLGTALLLNPTIWREVVADLQRWQTREGISNLQEIVGAANPDYKGKPAR